MSLQELQVGDQVLLWGRSCRLSIIQPDTTTGGALYYFQFDSIGGFLSQFSQQELEEAIECGYINYETIRLI